MSPPVIPKRSVRLAAVGDLLLTGGPKGGVYPRDPALIAPEVRRVLAASDVVFGNLECTLPGDGRTIATEPRVIATPELVRAVRLAGFTVVTLANNHAFDCFEPGFLQLRTLLDDIGLRHFGAGMDLDEATAPAVLEVNGLRLAFLGAADEQSGVTQFAAPDRPGVAPLDMDRLVRQVQELRTRVHHVIVSVHWGEERFLVPSPAQIEMAHALVDAGASLVLGHHPHVLQGLELRGKRAIVYSLGNFFADEVPFSNGDAVRWGRSGRTGCILEARLTDDGTVETRQRATYDPGDLVGLDHGTWGRRRLEKVRRAVAHGVTPARYRREHLWVKTIKPLVLHLRWSSLKKLRLHHFRKAWQRVFKRRG